MYLRIKTVHIGNYYYDTMTLCRTFTRHSFAVYDLKSCRGRWSDAIGPRLASASAVTARCALMRTVTRLQ